MAGTDPFHAFCPMRPGFGNSKYAKEPYKTTGLKDALALVADGRSIIRRREITAFGETELAGKIPESLGIWLQKKKLKASLVIKGKVTNEGLELYCREQGLCLMSLMVPMLRYNNNCLFFEDPEVYYEQQAWAQWQYTATPPPDIPGHTSHHSMLGSRLTQVLRTNARCIAMPGVFGLDTMGEHEFPFEGGFKIGASGTFRKIYQKGVLPHLLLHCPYVDRAALCGLYGYSVKDGMRLAYEYLVNGNDGCREVVWARSHKQLKFHENMLLLTPTLSRFIPLNDLNWWTRSALPRTLDPRPLHLSWMQVIVGNPEKYHTTIDAALFLWKRLLFYFSGKCPYFPLQPASSMIASCLENPAARIPRFSLKGGWLDTMGEQEEWVAFVKQVQGMIAADSEGDRSNLVEPRPIVSTVEYDAGFLKVNEFAEYISVNNTFTSKQVDDLNKIAARHKLGIKYSRKNDRRGKQMVSTSSSASLAPDHIVAFELKPISTNWTLHSEKATLERAGGSKRKIKREPRSGSESPDRRKRSRSRPHHSRKRSRSRSSSKASSKSPSPSRSRSPTPTRSRSPSPARSRSHSRAASRSPSLRRSRSGSPSSDGSGHLFKTDKKKKRRISSSPPHTKKRDVKKQKRQEVHRAVSGTHAQKSSKRSISPKDNRARLTSSDDSDGVKTKKEAKQDESEVLRQKWVVRKGEPRSPTPDLFAKDEGEDSLVAADRQMEAALKHHKKYRTDPTATFESRDRRTALDDGGRSTSKAGTAVKTGAHEERKVPQDWKLMRLGDCPDLAAKLYYLEVISEENEELFNTHKHLFSPKFITEVDRPVHDWDNLGRQSQHAVWFHVRRAIIENTKLRAEIQSLQGGERDPNSSVRLDQPPVLEHQQEPTRTRLASTTSRIEEEVKTDNAEVKTVVTKTVESSVTSSFSKADAEALKAVCLQFPNMQDEAQDINQDHGKPTPALEDEKEGEDVGAQNPPPQDERENANEEAENTQSGASDSQTSEMSQVSTQHGNTGTDSDDDKPLIGFVVPKPRQQREAKLKAMAGIKRGRGRGRGRK